MKSLYYVLSPAIGGTANALAWLWDGPAANVGGLEGRKVFDPLTPTGFRGSSNSYAELSVPAVVDLLRSVCLGIAIAAAAALIVNRFLRELRLPGIVAKGLYGLALATAFASWFALRSRERA